ncbi:urease accessory protein UreF [Paenibacillus elgii]|uniref:urease accessory protein UreF n=1 Tax=Paenibacillus elgii TaxID=189691 RepID=UPI00167AB7EC|nr:urease accessory protein UreF [Paenibacillus elgii]
MDKQWLTLLQWCDSNLPTGAFSHSFGLETYMQEGKVTDKHSFKKWLKVYIREQLIYSDGLAFRLVSEALQAGEPERVWEIDRILFAQLLPREVREASQRMGERMLKLGNDLYQSPSLADYQQRVREGLSFGHPAIVFALLARHFEISPSQALLSYLFSCTTSLIQNGVRGIPLGQTDGQQLIHELQEELIQAVDRIGQLEPDDLGIASPGLECSQMIHERLHVRLFMS